MQQLLDTLFDQLGNLVDLLQRSKREAFLLRTLVLFCLRLIGCAFFMEGTQLLMQHGTEAFVLRLRLLAQHVLDDDNELWTLVCPSIRERRVHQRSKLLRGKWRLAFSCAVTFNA
ncbi:hypothetical protein D3C86_1066320 [compost metagenome]